MLASISSGNLDGTNGFVIHGINAGDLLGCSVSGAGDINGDGFDDLIIGARGVDPNGITDAGASYVVFGKASGFAHRFELSSLDGTNGFVLNGADEWYASGHAVSGAGDINGDGFDDLVVAGVGFYAYYTVKTSFIFGKADAFDASVELSSINNTDGFTKTLYCFVMDDAGDVNGDGFDDLITGNAFTAGHNVIGLSDVIFGQPGNFVDNVHIVQFYSPKYYAFFGFAVSGAGDINGDGLDDLVVGAPGDFGFSDCYVVFGTPDSFAGGDNTSHLDGTNGFVLKGAADYDQCGKSVTSLGDINGDGFDDLGVSAPGHYTYDPSSGTFTVGACYVIFGKSGGFSASPDLSALDGTDGFIIEKTGGGVGAIRGVGDFNGDGIDDALIAVDGGNCFVVFGKAGGFGASLDLGGLDAGEGVALMGFSGVLKDAGDINGDGFDDLIIGNQGGDPGGRTDAGESYVIYGGDFGGKVDQLGDDGDNILTGTAGADILLGAQGDDVLIGLGGTDVLKGGAGDDILAIADVGFARLFGGHGVDTIRFDGTGLTFDLTTFPDPWISDIEAIDLNGGGNQLIVDAQEVLSINNRSNTLSIYGDAGDMVTASGFVADGMDGDLIRYVDATGSLAVLLVDSDVTVTLASIDQIKLGTSGDDTLAGAAGDDTLKSFAGNDRLYGWGGNDSLIGGEGNDSLMGDAGNDSARGGPGNDYLGQRNADSGTGDDVYTGGDGNDTLEGGSGSDRLIGGLGSDVFIFGAFEVSDGVRNTDVIVDFQRNQHDIVYLTSSVRVVHSRVIGGDVVLTLSGADHDQIRFKGVGSVDNITVALVGDDHRNGISGTDQDDLILGFGSNDTLIGDAGNDTLEGDAGNDTLQGGAGNDRGWGGPNNDYLGERDAISGTGNDFYDGGYGNDTLEGGIGNDTVLGSLGADSVNGGDGDDHVSGDQGRDTLIGGAGNDQLVGGGNRDRIDGGDGNDTLRGDESDDTLMGGDGADRLIGGAGGDHMTGDNGADRFIFRAEQATDGVIDHDVITDYDPLNDKIEVHAGVVVEDHDVIGGNLILTLTGGDQVELQGITNFADVVFV